jgi:hypothetical protein
LAITPLLGLLRNDFTPFLPLFAIGLGGAAVALGEVHELRDKYRTTRIERFQLRVGFVCGLLAVLGSGLLFASMFFIL